MALKDIINTKVHEYYWVYDHSCAITSLKILTEIFDIGIDPQILSAAFGLNAGRNRLQCGLVQGTLMFLGIYYKNLEPNEIANICHEYINSFQDEFGSIECKELRPQGFSPDNPPHLCEQLTKNAIFFATQFIYKTNDEYNVK